MSAEETPTSTSTSDVDATAEELSKSALVDNITKKGKNAYYYAHAHKATGPKWDGKIEPRLLSTNSSNLSSTNSNDDDGAVVSSSIASIKATPIAKSSTTTTNYAFLSSKAALMAKSNITNYAFLDEVTKVKIYVNLPGVGNCRDENIALDFTERSLCLTIKNYMAPSAAKASKVEVDESLVVDTAPPEAEEEEEIMTKEEEKGEDRCLSLGKLFGLIENATFRKKADKVIITLTKKDKRAWRSVIV
mmetsp:Transcript_19907/g.35271  ORF Transcript_19907/g.35271 Transcript_19907/m.35271 type:complete len:247 (-) Transcript_19907:328-1068(-)|eukprot:CAMPEP_0201898740 /NCGR_PEP_ID=MMETSP0902-20130614/49098_1 /ASSEMBLY_ACC=CAM_ASM_000551 /TAXON_ID=420261 /ORGANISM="Thalassiosira antarctica, Strain CCMP982" /LENGTH=246 /DNA_ID=CAMNT_0048431965 /DNA_START=38 /DNA_END=778 /DNA_ORIENTATION=+